jgi:GNAT superfamily N-acetyltransferase
MLNEINGLLRITRADINPAAVTLAKAFQDYPESVYLMPDEVERRKKQLSIYRRILKGAIVYSEVFATSPRMEGVAVWQLVDGKHPAWGRRFSFSWWWTSLFMDKKTSERQKAYFKYAAAVRTRVTPERYWYLQILGVDPDFQGQGYSSRLLKPMLEWVEREALPCFLETQLETNVPLYEHFGFRVVEAGIIPGGNIKSWAMVKKP